MRQPFILRGRLRGPALRRSGVRLVPGDLRTGSPSPVMSCTTRGLPCLLGRPWSGGLLPHPFTLTCAGGRARGPANPPSAVYFLRHFPSGGPWRPPSLAFTRRAALWCPDFPRTVPSEEDRPATARGTAHPLSTGSPANATGKFHQFPPPPARPRVMLATPRCKPCGGKQTKLTTLLAS